MSPYTLLIEREANTDVESALDWYESEKRGLGLEFLDEVRATYHRILEGPLRYLHLRSGIRRALVHRFPYAVYFACEGSILVIVAVQHASRDPAEWQRRIR